MTQVQGPQIYDLDMNHVAEEADRADSQFFNFANGKTCLFFLPPWSSLGRFAKPVYKCFLGGKNVHVTWKTYAEHLPEWAERAKEDPVVKAVKELQGLFGKDTKAIKDAWPRGQYYTNAILVSTQENDGVEPTLLAPKSSVVPLPTGVYNFLIKEMKKKSVGSIVHPARAVCVVVEKSGKGMQTEYKCSLSGTSQGGRFTPLHENLFERFGEQVLNELLSNMQNLDELYPPPGEGDVLKAQKMADEFRSSIMSGNVAGVNPGGPPPGVGGVPQFAPPQQFMPPQGPAPMQYVPPQQGPAPQQYMPPTPQQHQFTGPPAPQVTPQTAPAPQTNSAPPPPPPAQA